MTGYSIRTHKPADEPEAIAIERREAFELVMLARRAPDLATEWSDDHKQAVVRQWRTVAKEISDAADYVDRLVPTEWVPEFLRTDTTLPLFARRQVGPL